MEAGFDAGGSLARHAPRYALHFKVDLCLLTNTQQARYNFLRQVRAFGQVIAAQKGFGGQPPSAFLLNL